MRVAERGRRSSSTFPHITLSPTSYHNNEQVHLDIYTRVHAEREGVWAGDKALSLKSRSSRKLTTLERLSLLADEGSEVIHIGSLAGLDMPYGNVVNGSMEVAIVTVCGQMCVVTGNDWTIKGGTIYPIGVKKQLRGQEIALQNNLPCIYIADSGGAFLPLQVTYSHSTLLTLTHPHTPHTYHPSHRPACILTRNMGVEYSGTKQFCPLREYLR